MTPKESVQILAILTAAYPNTYKNLDEDAAAAVAIEWAVQFADVPADIVYMAVQKAISASKYAPSIYEVKEKISALHWEAYEELRRAQCSHEIQEEYRRIYELTEGFRYKNDGPEIKKMLPYMKQAIHAGLIEGK